MLVTEDVMANTSAEVLQFPENRKWNGKAVDRRFRAHFGCSVVVATTVWNHIHENLKETTKPKHLLWGLLFIKVYASQDVHCRIVGWPDPKTFRNWSWYILEKVAGLKEQIIVLDNRFDGFDGSTTSLLSVDCIDCPVMEPWPFDEKWYSQKMNGPALKYEVAVCIKSGHIVWTNGPHPASHNDATIFINTLANLLADDEGVEVDGVYKGHNKLKAPTVATSRDERKQKSQARGRHENVNGRLKIFNVLNTPFRHTGEFATRSDVLMEKHGMCFDAVAVITQIGFCLGEKIYDVEFSVDYS